MNTTNESDTFITFQKYFAMDDKEQCVLYILEKLQSKELDVLDLYKNILAPSLMNLECHEDPNLCIWKEHIKTGIVRTILECCYPYILNKREELSITNSLKAVVLCPPEEYHDVGARMVSDFLTVCGCQTIYVGSNTPYQDFYRVINVIDPDLVAISVSNYYNLVITKKIIAELKNAAFHPIKVVVGGHAFADDPHKAEQVGADFYARSFEDIKDITVTLTK